MGWRAADRDLRSTLRGSGPACRPSLFTMSDADRPGAAQFKGALDAAPDAMVMTDRLGRIVLLNVEALRLFGYEGEELTGRPVEVLIPERFRAAHPHHRNRYFTDPAHPADGLGGGARPLRPEEGRNRVPRRDQPLAARDGGRDHGHHRHSRRHGAQEGGVAVPWPARGGARRDGHHGPPREDRPRERPGREGVRLRPRGAARAARRGAHPAAVPGDAPRAPGRLLRRPAHPPDGRGEARALRAAEGRDRVPGGDQPVTARDRRRRVRHHRDPRRRRAQEGGGGARPPARSARGDAAGARRRVRAHEGARAREDAVLRQREPRAQDAARPDPGPGRAPPRVRALLPGAPRRRGDRAQRTDAREARERPPRGLEARGGGGDPRPRGRGRRAARPPRRLALRGARVRARDRLLRARAAGARDARRRGQAPARALQPRLERVQVHAARGERAVRARRGSARRGAARGGLPDRGRGQRPRRPPGRARARLRPVRARRGGRAAARRRHGARARHREGLRRAARRPGGAGRGAGGRRPVHGPRACAGGAGRGRAAAGPWRGGVRVGGRAGAPDRSRPRRARWRRRGRGRTSWWSRTTPR